MEPHILLLVIWTTLVFGASAMRLLAMVNSRPVPAIVRYCVIGLGHIAQNAVLPAFANAQQNSKLTALISHDKAKLSELSRKYGVSSTWSYEEYDAALKSGEFDAIYIALPNDMHKDVTLRAAQAGVHVLCEKPMALTQSDCQEMIDAAARHNVKLMIAYRLHFEQANLEAIKCITSGAIGAPRYFSSIFSMQVREGNIRVQPQHGGGPLYDLGVYCINAARYLFRSEPYKVTAIATSNEDPRFTSVEEMAAAIMSFPESRLAQFTCSFGAVDAAEYTVVGTKGSITLKQGYEYRENIEMFVTAGKHTDYKKFPLRDQFAPELLYFSECIKANKQPEPSGSEGLLDVRVIEAIHESSRSGKTIELPFIPKAQRPAESQEIIVPGQPSPTTLHVEPPSL